MKTIELSTGTLVVVDLPVECINGSVYEDAMGSWLLCYSYVGKLPSSGFQLLGHPSEISGEVWGKVVTDEYGVHMDMVHEGMIYDTPLQSGLSLCAAHNIQESDVLLFKAKNS